MPSSFGKYTGGIQPVQGLFEMGAQIGKNYAAGITDLAENLTKGVEDYRKVQRESEYADAEYDAEGAKYTALAEMLGSEPETAHLVEGITPILETIAKGRKGGHSAKMAGLSQVKAQGKALNETFGYMNLVQGAKARRLFGEANALPAEGEEVVTKSISMNPADTKWSKNLSYGENVERVRGKYRAWMDANREQLSSGKFKVMSEEEFISNWRKRLPSAIDNDPSLNPEDKAWAKDILSNNDIINQMAPEDQDDPQALFMRDWATINPYVGSGAGDSGINAEAAPEGTVAQTVPQAAWGQWNPQALKLAAESQNLIDESKRLSARVGRGWFGGDDEARARIAEINKQLEDNRIIIQSLGGAPLPRQITQAEISRTPTTPLRAYTQADFAVPPEPEVVEPEVVVAPPKVAEDIAAPTASPQVQPQAQSQPKAPAPMAPAKVQEQPQATAPAAPAKDTDKPTGAKLQRILANEQLAIDNFNKKNREGWEKGQSGTKTITLGEVKGSRAAIQRKYNVSLQELIRLNPQLKNEDQFFNFKGGKATFDEKYAGVEIKVPDRKNPPSRATMLSQLPTDMLARLKKQNGGYLSTEQEPEYPSAPISEEEATGGTPPATVDEETGTITINTNLEAMKNQVAEEVEGGEEGVDVPQFTPLKIKPISGSVPTITKGILPDLPTNVKVNYTPEEQTSIKIAARHIQETTNNYESQQRAIQPAIDYLESIKDNVINGDGSAADFAGIGQLQKENPDLATAIDVAGQAASLWYGGGWGKTMKFANQIEKTNYVAKKSEIARKHAQKIIDGIRSAGKRVETDDEIRRAVASGLKQAGLVTRDLAKKDYDQLVNMSTKSLMKSAVFQQFANELVGNEPFTMGDDINDKLVRGKISEVLKQIRKARGNEGFIGEQWREMVPFGMADKPITANEISKIRKVIDTNIQGLVSLRDENATRLKTIKAGATPDNLLRLAKELETNAQAELAAQEIAEATGQVAMDEQMQSDEIEVGAQPIVSKDFVIPQSAESRKTQLRDYMKSQLGYVPDGFEDMYRKQFPETTLQLKETPYGVFYGDGKGDWKPLASTGAKTLQPHEVAANKAVQFGMLKEDGTYEPTEFIKGTGIKLGGIGTFGTPSDATKFRMEYTRKIKALRYADELRNINEITFRSMMPSQWGTAKAKVASLVAQMRQELIGVGSVSDFEQKLLKDLVADPTDFFRLQSTVRSTYEELIDKLSRSLVEDPQSYGLDVQMPKDRQAQMKNMRGIYLAQQERYKNKMAEFEKSNPKVEPKAETE